MDTKLKKLTARTTVKLSCFLLAIAMCIVFLNRFNACIERANTERISTDVVLSDLSGYQVVYQNHMSAAVNYARDTAMYISAESILAGEHILWQEDTQEYWNNGDVYYSYEYRLMDARRQIMYSSVSEEAYNDPALRADFENDAIRRQLADFRKTLDILDGKYGDSYGTDGIIYYIQCGDFVYSNAAADRQSAQFFKSLPVYYTTDGLGVSESSHHGAFFYDAPVQMSDYGDSGTASFAVIRLGFELPVVSSIMQEYERVRSAYITDIVIMLSCAVLFLVFFAVLLLGAGRRAIDGGESVHFTFLDKTYLDLSLALTIGWAALVFLFAIDWFYYPIETSRNSQALFVLLAVCAVLTVPFALLWFISFAKRLKAGHFLRHTLVFAVIHGLCKLSKALWAGVRLSLKVGLISAVSFGLMFISGIALAATHEPAFFMLLIFIFTAAVTFFLLRYARRIRKLELGAKAVSGGDYDFLIEVGGGELGHIADSINNISSGINKAVNERMKSERLKTELITNVSHDIRTPLTSIITYTDLLKNEGLNCDNASEYLDVLIQKSQRLKTLTDELFEASKAATGNIDVQITELDLVSLINQVLGELDGSIKSSGLDLRINLPERLLVMADGKLMWRVFENLLSNVFKYSLKNSRVYLSAEREAFTVRIELKNISATELNVDPSELTERFKRGDESRADGGSGLGLSIVQSFMSAQGGRLALSIDGDLFKATLHLPLASPV